MADHQATKTDDQNPEGTLPAGANPESSTDDKAALLSELVKHRQEAAAYKAELERLAKAEKPKSVPPQAQDGDPILARLEVMERRDRLRELMSEHDLNARQADAVADIMQKMPDLDATEAKSLAAHRDKALFSAEDPASGYDPSVHGSNRPTPGSAPTAQAETDTDERLAHIAKLRKAGDKKGVERYLNNLTGSIAAQQTGRTGHKRIPIPRT